MAAKKKTATKTGKNVLAATKRKGPVAKVWDTVSSMPKAARRDVIAACVAKGINENTAKTQYQRCLHRSD